MAAIRYPFIGLLTWAWFTLMTPHQAAFGVYGIPLNVIIAGITIGSYVVSGEIAKFRLDPISFLFAFFAGWLFISQKFSLDPESSAIFFDRFVKTLIFVILCAQMAIGKLRVNALVWTLVIAIGFFAVKGALFTILTFGEFRVQGLPRTVLEDNNHFGIAVATVLPLILYLRGQSERLWVRRGLIVLFGLSIVAIIGTHSRGAFLSLIAFSGFFWLRSKYKLTSIVALGLLLIPTIAFMPGKWTERMFTIQQATQDASFMGRVDAWVINIKLAKENPVTGAGLRNSYQEEIAKSVDPERALSAKAAHSIYFEILGGAGVVGLGIYLLLFGVALISAWYLYLRSKKMENLDWRGSFAYYAQISLVVFAIGGASTSMEMWDGYLVIMGLIAATMKMPKSNKDKTGYALRNIRAKNWRRKKRLHEIFGEAETHSA